MRFRAVGAVAVAAAALAASAGATRAVQHGGMIGVYATPSMSGPGKILFTGAIGDSGTATSIDKNGKVNPNGGYVKIVLKHGGFEVNMVALNKKANSAPPTTDSKVTCSSSFSVSGPVTVFNGTGMYAGISGVARITETFAGIGPRYTSGPKKGQCNASNNAPPIAFFASVIGSGTVAFR
jgi:hypothetical protein